MISAFYPRANRSLPSKTARFAIQGLALIDSDMLHEPCSAGRYGRFQPSLPIDPQNNKATRPGHRPEGWSTEPDARQTVAWPLHCFAEH